MLKPLKRAIRTSSVTGNIPAFVHVDLDEVCGGAYDWRRIREIITRECGWVSPDDEDKGLHTSCSIEKCKEHSQFVRFYNMQSTMMPFSALELSIACSKGSISREQAMTELEGSLGFSLPEVAECSVMREYIKR